MLRGRIKRYLVLLNTQFSFNMLAIYVKKVLKSACNLKENGQFCCLSGNFFQIVNSPRKFFLFFLKSQGQCDLLSFFRNA